MQPPAAEFPPPSATRPEFLRAGLIGVTLVLAAVLIFARLGHYAFWDDEAATALGAKAIMQTGRNTALVDHGNIVAYDNGTALHGFDNRLEPLFPAYLTAASFEVFGINTWAGRLPFALLGLGTFALMMLWARRESWPAVAVLALALLGNVSLVLYSRNCRYYGAAIFFSVALAYIYLRRKPTAAGMLGFAALSILLFASNYFNYVAFYVCLGLDYVLWQRRESSLNARLLSCLLLPQIVVNGALAVLWNPLQTPQAGNMMQNSLLDRLTLFCWQWRDMNFCENLCPPLLLLALGVGLAQRRPLLVRGCVALVVYVAVVVLISKQVVHGGEQAAVRHMTPVIPLAIGLEAAALCALFGNRTLPLIGVALLAFGTNLLNGGLLLGHSPRSTLVSYAKELADPIPEPYGLTAAWIDAHVPEGGSVLVTPPFAVYPLMFYAPRALYAWQFQWPPRPGYDALPRIHFEGQVAPDFVVAFGPGVMEESTTIQLTDDSESEYRRAATINIYWMNLERPEIFWHSFDPVAGYDPERDTIQIFRRAATTPAPADR